jgi:hypothetical protein
MQAVSGDRYPVLVADEEARSNMLLSGCLQIRAENHVKAEDKPKTKRLHTGVCSLFFARVEMNLPELTPRN